MIDPPLSRAEVESWLDGLADTRAGRIIIIKDLLRHALGDEMTAEDRAICRQELVRLQQQATSPPHEEYHPCQREA